MSYRHGKYTLTSLVLDLVRMFFDDDYDPNKRRARRYRSSSPDRYGYDPVKETYRNEQLRDALYEQMAEDKARKERYEQILKEQQAAQIGRPKYHSDDDEPKMDSLF